MKIDRSKGKNINNNKKKQSGRNGERKVDEPEETEIY